MYLDHSDLDSKSSKMEPLSSPSTGWVAIRSHCGGSNGGWCDVESQSNSPYTANSPFHFLQSITSKKNTRGCIILETWQWTPILVPLRVFKSSVGNLAIGYTNQAAPLTIPSSKKIYSEHMKCFIFLLFQRGKRLTF